MPEPGLETLRRGIPCTRLALLAALASGKETQISIGYFDANHLNIHVTPC
jgi:hypothetical protein